MQVAGKERRFLTHLDMCLRSIYLFVIILVVSCQPTPRNNNPIIVLSDRPDETNDADANSSTKNDGGLNLGLDASVVFFQDAGLASNTMSDAGVVIWDSGPNRYDAGIMNLDAGSFSGCGDGIVVFPETCDEGFLFNSDVLPNTCRTNCVLPFCGDNVLDTGEACDDGNQWGGDGCNNLCNEEEGVLDIEANDTPALATPMTGEDSFAFFGRLTADDVDCYSFQVPYNGYVDVLPVYSGSECLGDTILTLYEHENEVWNETASDDNSGAGFCAALSAQEKPSLRYLRAGDYAVCISSFQGFPVDGYGFQIDVYGDSCGSDVFELTVDSDPDFDGLPGGCDHDSDNDGFADNNDNCPYVSNGDSAPIFFPDHDGYIRSWLWRGPYQVPGESCLPQGVNLIGNEATIAPSTGDGLNTPFWETHHDNANYVDLNADMGGGLALEKRICSLI